MTFWIILGEKQPWVPSKASRLPELKLAQKSSLGLLGLQSFGGLGILEVVALPLSDISGLFPGVVTVALVAICAATRTTFSKAFQSLTSWLKGKRLQFPFKIRSFFKVPTSKRSTSGTLNPALFTSIRKPGLPSLRNSCTSSLRSVLGRKRRRKEVESF